MKPSWKKTQEEVIAEMSIAGYGDWKPTKEMIGYKSAFIMKKKWNKVADFKTKSGRELSLYRSPSSNIYIAGLFHTTSNGEEIFEIDFEIGMKEYKSIAKTFNIKQKLMNVDGVRVKEDMQGDGIAVAVYKILVKQENINILGDEKQYFGARKLWVRLSKHIDVKVDIVDILKDKVLETDVILYHGNEDWEFDSRVWSYTPEKKDIRLILKDIK